MTTLGFKDVLLERPRPLAAREHRFEVDARALADGAVHRPLNLATVDAAAEAIAVVFPHAYRSPSHEARARTRLLERLPSLRVSPSPETAGEIREYDRASTTLANAYVQAVLDTYLRGVEDELDRWAALGMRHQPTPSRPEGGVFAGSRNRSRLW